MCLAIPAEITELLPDAMAKVSLDGVTKQISVALIENPQVGDYVVLHVGFALTRIDADEARRTLALIGELGNSSAEAAA